MVLVKKGLYLRFWHNTILHIETCKYSLYKKKRKLLMTFLGGKIIDCKKRFYLSGFAIQ